MSRLGADRLSGLRERIRLADRRLAAALTLLASVLVIVAHAPLRHGTYVQDDLLAVAQNPIVERGDPAEIFSTSYWAGANGEDASLYRPLTILSYALERRLTGVPRVLVSRGVNVALHLAVTLLLFALARRIGVGPFAAAAAALLFAVHPVHMEAVANVVGRAEILAALWSLAGLLALTHAGPWRRAGRLTRGGPLAERLAAWAAAVCLFLALGSKETALATPLLYVACELLFRPREGGRGRFWIDRAAALAPSVLAGSVYLMLRVRALEMLLSLQQAHPGDNPLVLLHGVERAATALGLVARYARLLLFPLGLSIDYSGPVIDVEPRLLGWLPLAGSAVLAALGALALAPLWRPRDGRGVRPRSFAACLFLLPYLVIGNLLFSVGTIFAERLLYLPSAGFCLLMGMLFGRVADAGAAAASRERRVAARRTAALALAALIAAFTALSWARAHDWRDNETVFTSATRVRPRSPRAHFIVGKILADRGEPQAALAELREALDLDPRFVSAWNEAGVAHGKLGELAAAEAAFRRAVSIAPSYAEAHFNLGVTLRRERRFDEAERSLRRALAWDPAFAKAWAEYGHLMLERGRNRRAARAYERAVRLGREDLVPRLREAERRATSRPASGSGGS